MSSRRTSSVPKEAVVFPRRLYCDSRCSETLPGLSPTLPGALLCNETRLLGDGKRVILRQRVKGSVQAIRAVRNTRLVQTETRVVADVTAWLADCPKYGDLHHLKRHVCFWCGCPKNKLGDDLHPDKQDPQRVHNLYRPPSNANTKAADAELSSHPVHRGFNVFPHIPCFVSDLPKADLLHTMQIGMLDHLQNWIFHFEKTPEGLDKYNAIWLSVLGYHDLTPKHKSHEEVSQWNGKKMMVMSRYQLGVVNRSL